MDDVVFAGGTQASPVVARALEEELTQFLTSLIARLDTLLDKRLVRTLVASILALLEWRHRAHGLLLSELGAYICDPAHAPAGTKRLSNLLRSPKWEATRLSGYLWRQATQRLAALETHDDTPLLIWDTSVLEKPESLASPDLGSVRSSKARRLTRIKPGFYHPPTRPLFVPGWRWIGLLLGGSAARVGRPASRTCAGGRRADRAPATRTGSSGSSCRSAPRPGAAASCTSGIAAMRAAPGWTARWRSRCGSSCAGRGATACSATAAAWTPCPPGGSPRARAWEYRLLWDARRHVERRTGVLAIPVWRRNDHLRTQPLWLVVARRGQGQEPWHLLTTEPVTTAEEAWRIVYAYARRWQIELGWRYGKSELALESPRVWSWERRQKFLLLAALAYAFLLSLLRDDAQPARQWLLRFWCHRTGKRSREASTPLYRLRSALSRLWLAYLAPPGHVVPQNSG